MAVALVSTAAVTTTNNFFIFIFLNLLSK